VPVAPFIFLSGWLAVVTSAVLSALALFGIGAAITLMTGRSVLFSGTRQVVIGIAAAALTYGLGTLLGVAMHG
jgi:VIT1/CCC1 family predicted Fe2+/Mn2+ transporter